MARHKLVLPELDPSANALSEPSWTRLPPRPDAAPGEQPPMSEARLDVRIPEPSGRGRILNVDVGFADPYTADLAELRRRARLPGRAAAE